MRTLRTGRVVTAALVVAAIAGCAGVPESGRVYLGAPVAAAGSGGQAGAIRQVPALPQPDAGPVQLVGGFLRAMVDRDNDYAVARSYLEHGTTWNAASGTTVYAQPATISRVAPNAVSLRVRRVGVIAPNGTYRVLPGREQRSFTLSRRSGEWRITSLPAGALLSTDDAERILQPASVYFLTPDGRRVVPQPVLETPADPGLATTLVHALLAGPDPLLAPGVRSAAPRGTLLVGNVPISAGGVAEVDLSAGARQLTPSELQQLSAQIVWTLRQVASVTAVRLLANGTPITAPDVASLQPIRSWAQFDPDVAPATPGALLVSGDSVVALGTVVPQALRVPGLTNPARSADGSMVAALRRGAGGEQLLVGPAGGRLRVRLTAESITALAFGPDGRVVVATSPGTLYSVGSSGAPRRVRLPHALAGRQIRSLAFSPDGTRLALAMGTTQREMRVATIRERAGVMAIARARLVLPATDKVAGVGWASSQELVTTIAGSDRTRHVVEVSVDGYTVFDLTGPGLPTDVDHVAAAPDEPVLASDGSGTWRLGGHRWDRVSGGHSPSYAG